MTKKYMVGVPKVIERGNLDGKMPFIEYVPSPYYGVHDSINAAKCAYVIANDSDWAKSAEERVVQQFDAWRRNGFLGGAKVLRVSEAQP